MRVLILNLIISTSVNGKIIRRPTNHDTMIYNLARGFVRAGHEPVLCVSEEFMPEQLPESEPFEIVYFPSRFPRLFKPYLLPWPRGLRKYLRANRNKFDLVLSVESFSIPTLIAATSGIRSKMMIWQELAFHQHTMAKMPSKIWHNVAGRLFFRNVPMLTQSEAARKFCRPYYRNIATDVLGHGANEDVFKPSAESGDYFVVMSMLVFRKRIDEILRQFALFVSLPRYRHFVLRIIGEGPEKVPLQMLTKDLGIADKVSFEGFKTHKEYAEIGSRAKGLLIRTQQDNNMVTVPEAIVNGTPILMNTVPNNHTFVSNLGLGVVKDAWGPDELADMVENYSTYHSNCLKHRDLFTTTGVARKIVDVYSCF